MRITGTGNVGIGSVSPVQALDVIGTVRATNFTLTGQTPTAGYVLTASDSSGDATWSSAGAVGGWTVNGTNVYATTGSNNVGIGTTTPQGSLVVTNGNVGIGTWAPVGSLDVKTGTVFVENGSVGIGSTGVGGKLSIWTPTDGNNLIYLNDYSSNNVSFSADINTTDKSLATKNLTWTSASAISDMSFSPSTGAINELVLKSSGNVGIGTFTVNSTLAVNGGSTIGSGYVTNNSPSNGLLVQGNVGIGSVAPGQKLDVQGTTRTTNFTMTGIRHGHPPAASPAGLFPERMSTPRQEATTSVSVPQPRKADLW
jgi:hypothetical protein